MKNNKCKQIIVQLLCGILLAGCGGNATVPATQPMQESVSEHASEADSASVPEHISEADPELTSEPSQEPSSEQPSESAPEQSPSQESPHINLIMVGDILLHTPVEESALQEDGSYCFDKIFENTREELQAADLALVNQEVILGGEELGISGYPAFNAPYAVGDALVEAGFDVVCHGTNHALDKGKKGILNCLAFWEESYPEIGVLGIHDSAEEEDEIYIYEQDGISIAILNYTYSTNGIAMPADMPYAVDMLDQEKVLEDIRLAEEQADFTIVCPHWGTEYRLEADSSQEKWTRLFLENGVDLVLGTHPHVIEPIEWVKDEETGQEMLVYYSLGNYVNWTSSSGEGIANRMVGGMAQVTIGRKEDGKVFIEDYGVEPVVAHLEKGVNGVTVYFLEEYTEELAAANEIVKQDSAFSLQYCERLCEQVWGDYYHVEKGSENERK